MTALAEIATVLRLPDLTPLDRASLLVTGERAFERLQTTRTNATKPGSDASPPPEGPEGEE